MSKRTSPGESRIVKALTIRPMTVAELESTAYVTQHRVRFLLRRLNTNGVVCLGGPAPRVNAPGSPPRYWELVGERVAA